MHLVASIGDSRVLPTLRTDLVVNWGFGSVLNQPGSPVTTENPLAVNFTNVEMNIGEFFGGFVGDVSGPSPGCARTGATRASTR